MADMPPSLKREQQILERFMWLSIAVSILTIALKMFAAWVTGSVGFMSDAIETVINLVAAVVSLWALKLSAKPADENHNFGHSKAEYFSAQVEGSLILVAAVAIIYTSIERLLHPQPLEQLGVGLIFSVVAAILNAVAGYALVRAGRRYRSATLESDGKHLLTDVLTTVGVIVGMALVAITGWEILDPIVALLVGANILYTGFVLLRSAILSLLSEALPAEELEKVNSFLDTFAEDNGVAFTSVRTAAFGRERFISLVMQVPGEWTVSYAHAHADEIESGVANALGAAETIVHVDPFGYTTRTGPIFGDSLTNSR